MTKKLQRNQQANFRNYIIKTKAKNKADIERITFILQRMKLQQQATPTDANLNAKIKHGSDFLVSLQKFDVKLLMILKEQ